MVMDWQALAAMGLVPVLVDLFDRLIWDPNHTPARQSHSKEILFRKRVAENAPQTSFTSNQRSRGFSATHFLKKRSCFS